MPVTLRCPLCAASGDAYHHDGSRDYLRCPRCSLVFVPPEQRLNREAEFAEYLLHDNRIDDPGYRRFLSRLADPLCARLAPAARGLDFGCGPAPALAVMLAQLGHRVELHDSFFCPAPEKLEQSYDFVTATEVVEHLHDPAVVLEGLWDCVRPGGVLAVMTKLAGDLEAFARWHYIRDPTHVCFFSEATWRWWTASRPATLEFIGRDVILITRDR